jgi:hypothetical protein
MGRASTRPCSWKAACTCLEKDPRVVNSKQDFDPIDKFLWPNMRFAVSYNAGKWFEPSKYLADYYTDEAVNAIRKNRNRPFFCTWRTGACTRPCRPARKTTMPCPRSRTTASGSMRR